MGDGDQRRAGGQQADAHSSKNMSARKSMHFDCNVPNDLQITSRVKAAPLTCDACRSAAIALAYSSSSKGSTPPSATTRFTSRRFSLRSTGALAVASSRSSLGAMVMRSQPASARICSTLRKDAAITLRAPPGRPTLSP
jgi:hypothetical protein